MGRVYDVYAHEVEMKLVVSSDGIPDVDCDVPCVVEIICSNSVVLHSHRFVIFSMLHGIHCYFDIIVLLLTLHRDSP